MVIDTSALVAVLQDEPSRRALTEAVESADTRLLSAASLVEASIVIDARYGDEGVRDLDLWLSRAGVQIEPVDAEQAQLARLAYRRFGKGRHEAGLNFGDCYSYALAKHAGEPLLFTGDDFAKTDVAAVPY